MNVVIKGNTFKSVVLSLIAIMLFAVISPDLAKANSEEYVPIPKTIPNPEESIPRVIPNPIDLLVPIPEVPEEYYNELAMGPLAVVSAVIGLVVGAMAIGKGYHNAGYWAAKQMHIKKGLTPRMYFNHFRTYLKIQITLAFGYIVWLGFDDYMYDKY